MLNRVAVQLLLPLCLCGALGAAELPGVWLDVPFVPQAKDGCGSASIAMVMQYWSAQQGSASRPEAGVDRIQQALYSRPAHGIYAADLERYLQEQHFRTFVFRGARSDLQQHLGKGRPLIVALRPSPVGSSLHYVVVAGINSEPPFVLVNDPAERKLLKRDWLSFEREWTATGNWTLLALPNPDIH